MNIWLISAFEPTPYDKSFSARFISIAEECRKRGHQVTFFSTTFKHSTKAQRFNKTTTIEIDEHYDLIFVKSDAYKKNISLKRMLSHSRLSKELVNELNNRGEKPDVIFMAYPPIATALSVSEWAEKNEVPFIVDIIDPWPDQFRVLMNKVPGIIQDLLLFKLIRKTKKIFGRVQAVTGIAKQRLEWVKQYNPNCDEFHYFYPAADLKEVQKKLSEIGKTVQRDDKLRVIYAGSFASSYDIPTILGAADILSSGFGDQIEFVLAGAGPQEDIINDYVKNHDNLRYVGRLSKEDLMKEYYRADVGLIQHMPGATQTVTYKLFDLMSCGMPVMNSLESELNDIVLENNVGFFNKTGDSATLAKNILYCLEHPAKLEEMKQRALEVTREIGDTTKVYSETVDLLEKIGSKKERNMQSTPAVK
jgi:glycosyltransferase involved in cell wall biosynthesis